MTPSPSLLFLPDISGFTRFVHETALEHGQYIVSQLLQTLINADELGMQVAEIEGDAVLFYLEGSVPPAGQLLVQAEHMYGAFHGWITSYVRVCGCDCAACQSVSQLTLKVIAHAGPLGFTQVRGQRKPFGETVVVVHRLLKNSIPSHEYVVLTDALLLAAGAPELPEAAQQGEAFYESVGQVGYAYLPLGTAAPVRRSSSAGVVASTGSGEVPTG